MSDFSCAALVTSVHQRLTRRKVQSWPERREFETIAEVELVVELDTLLQLLRIVRGHE